MIHPVPSKTESYQHCLNTYVQIRKIIGGACFIARRFNEKAKDDWELKIMPKPNARYEYEPLPHAVGRNNCGKWRALASSKM